MCKNPIQDFVLFNMEWCMQKEAEVIQNSLLMMLYLVSSIKVQETWRKVYVESKWDFLPVSDITLGNEYNRKLV